MASSALLEQQTQRNKTLNQMASLLSGGKQTEESRKLYSKLEATVAELDEDIAALRKIDSFREADSKRKLEEKVNSIPQEVVRHLGLNADGSEKKGEQRGLNTLTDASGGAVVPQEFYQQFVEALSFYGAIASKALRKDSETGRPTKFAVVNDTANGLILTSEASNTTAYDPVVFSNVAKTDALVSKFVTSFQFGDDVLSLDQLLNIVAASRAGRTLEKAITNGTDFAGNALTNAPTGGLLGVAGHAGALATAGTVAYADLAGLYSSVDPAYRGPNAAFYGHQTVNDYLAKQVDSTGRPLYKTDDNGNLLLVQKRPLLINQAMPALTSTGTGVQIGFGDASKALGYTLRDVRVQALEPTPETMTREYVFSIRFASVPLDASNAFKYLTV